jgi:hypothetical protein
MIPDLFRDGNTSFSEVLSESEVLRVPISDNLNNPEAREVSKLSNHRSSSRPRKDPGKPTPAPVSSFISINLPTSGFRLQAFFHLPTPTPPACRQAGSQEGKLIFGIIGNSRVRYRFRSREIQRQTEKGVQGTPLSEDDRVPVPDQVRDLPGSVH